MKRRMAHEDCGRILFAFVSACVVDKNLNTPNWSSMADDAITRGSIGVLGSLFYICGCAPPVVRLLTWVDILVEKA